MTVLKLTVASGDDLSVRQFSAEEAASALFSVSVWVRSPNPEVDLEAIVGKEATLHITHGTRHTAGMGSRTWKGVVAFAEQVQAEPTGLSTYYLRIVPKLYLLTQRRNYRIFQHLAVPDIIDVILGEHNVDHAWNADRGRYPKLEYKVQYGESDYTFLSRLLEEAGIAFVFADPDASGTLLTFDDQLPARTARAALRYVDHPNKASEKEFVTKVRLSHEVRPGAQTLRDYDFRNPGFPLFAEAPKAAPPESFYEQYQYKPGSFLIEKGKEGQTPVADDHGTARYGELKALVAVARSILVIIWHLLANPGMRYQDLGVDFHTKRIDIARRTRNHVRQREMAGFLGHAAMIDRLQQQVAKLVAQVRHVVARNRVRDLIGFLDRIGRDAGEVLLDIPRASAGGIAQTGHDGDERGNIRRRPVRHL